MVKEFTVKYANGYQDEKYVYDYDEKGDMKSMMVYRSNNLEEKYYKEGGKIKYKGYDHDAKCRLYDIQTDKDDNIVYIELILLEDINKPYSAKDEYIFEYDYDKNKKIFNKLHYIEFFYDKNRKKFSFVDEGEMKVMNDNGIYKQEGDWNVLVDINSINDTNISFHGMINPVIISNSYIEPLLQTDWINIRSDYFPKFSVDYKSIEYEYDNKGNIIQIRNRLMSKFTEVNITYVY